MAKLQQNNTNGSCWLIVPKALVRAKGWLKGDEFLVLDAPNGIKFTREEEKGVYNGNKLLPQKKFS